MSIGIEIVIVLVWLLMKRCSVFFAVCCSQIDHSNSSLQITQKRLAQIALMIARAAPADIMTEARLMTARAAPADIMTESREDIFCELDGLGGKSDKSYK